MGTMNLRRSLVGAAVALSLGLAAGPAGAVLVQGEFDPITLDGRAPNGFTLNVDNDCLTSVGFHHNSGLPFGNDGFCSVALTSASALVISTDPLHLYNGTLTFAPPVLTNPNIIFGVNVVFTNNAYTIDSFDTGLIHQVGANPYTGDDWWLQFRSGAIPLCFPNCFGGPALETVDGANPLTPTTLPRSVYLYVGGNPTPGDFVDDAQYLNIHNVVAVPEPGTLGLIVGALGGGWLARRRKKPKPTD